MPKTKVAAYCRVSTDKEDQLASLETQKKFFAEYAALHNYDLVSLYTDEGLSGTKLKNRKAFHSMMEDAKKGYFERVFVKDISRFARNAVDFLTSIRELKAMGIKCEFVNASLSTEDGEFTLGILALVAQEESANLSKRVKFGKAKNAAKGKVPNLVYGYDKVPGELFCLKINETESAVVKRIFQMYTEEGLGANKIAEYLNHQGYLTKRNCRFSQNAVIRILSNPIYIGHVLNGKEEVADYLTGIRVKRDKSQWHTSENASLAILSNEVFSAAQDILHERQQTFAGSHARQTGRYAFSRLIKCSHCGYSFRRVYRKYKTTESAKWVCSGRNAGGVSFCQNNTQIDEAKLTQEIVEYFWLKAQELSSLENDVAKEYNRLLKAHPPLDKQQELLAEKKRLERTLQKQIQLFEADAITEDALKERVHNLQMDIAKCNSALVSCTQNVNKQRTEDLKGLLTKAVGDNRLIGQMVKEIRVNSEGQVEVVMR